MQVSVIIPMYNESRYVWRCLDSLLQQTFQDFELIMIDDGSSDDTVHIVESYQNQFSELTILRQEHGWPGKARNRGVSIAVWDILVFVDADMIFDKHYLEELIKPIMAWDEIGTTHGREYVANKDNKIARAFSLIRASYDPQQVRWWVFRAIRKDKFIEAGWFDGSKGYTDDDLSKKIWSSLILSWPIAYHNNPESFWEIYHHSQRVGSSLWSSGEIIHYLQKYQWRVALFIIWLVLILYLVGIIKWLIGWLLLLLVLLFTKGVQRSIWEHYVSHIIYIPIVMIVRGIWYISGIVWYILSKRIY